MPDIFDIANAVRAAEAYREAEEKNDLIASEQSRRQAEMQLAYLQEKRLREQMLMGGQQFQQTFGLQERRFEEVEKPSAQSIIDIQAEQKRQATTLSDIMEALKGKTISTELSELGAKGATAEQLIEGIEAGKPYLRGRTIAESRAAISEAELRARKARQGVALLPWETETQRRELELAGVTAKTGLGLVEPQKEATLAELATKQKESELTLQWMIDNGTTEDIERIRAFQEQLRLAGEQIKNQTTELGIKQQQLNLATWEFEEAKKNPRVSPERLFQFEQDKMKLGVQVELLGLLSRVKESAAPVGVTTELTTMQRNQLYYVDLSADEGYVNPITDMAIGLGASYGITVTYKTVTVPQKGLFGKEKTYTIIETFYKDDKPILPGQEGAPGTPTNPEIEKDDKNFDTQIRNLIDNIEKGITMPKPYGPPATSPYSPPTPEEIERERRIGRASIIQPPPTTTTQPPPLVTNDEQTARGLIDLAISMGLDPLKSVEESTASPAVKAKARELLKNRLQSVK